VQLSVFTVHSLYCSYLFPGALPLSLYASVLAALSALWIRLLLFETEYGLVTDTVA
jgi:hypothetical protein